MFSFILIIFLENFISLLLMILPEVVVHFQKLVHLHFDWLPFGLSLALVLDSRLGGEFGLARRSFRSR